MRLGRLGSGLKGWELFPGGNSRGVEKGRVE